MSPKVVKIRAPLTGTFYEAPSPDAPPFVKIGKRINSGDVVCIVESMKVFTEVRSEYNGIIKNIFVKDEQPVLKDQELMEIEII